MIDTTTIIQVVFYLLHKVNAPISKLKLVKLIYFADKYHLLHYGRTITEDTYFAMQHGPVGSTILNVLNFNDSLLSSAEFAYAQQYLKKKGKYDLSACEYYCAFEMLSDTDTESLDFIIQQFANMETSQLVDLSHRYDEWNKHKHLFESGQTKRKEIPQEELLSTLPNDPFTVSKEDVEESLAILRARKCL